MDYKQLVSAYPWLKTHTSPDWIATVSEVGVTHDLVQQNHEHKNPKSPPMILEQEKKILLFSGAGRRLGFVGFIHEEKRTKKWWIFGKTKITTTNHGFSETIWEAIQRVEKKNQGGVRFILQLDPAGNGKFSLTIAGSAQGPNVRAKVMAEMAATKDLIYKEIKKKIGG